MSNEPNLAQRVLDVLAEKGWKLELAGECPVDDGGCEPRYDTPYHLKPVRDGGLVVLPSIGIENRDRPVVLDHLIFRTMGVEFVYSSEASRTIFDRDKSVDYNSVENYLHQHLNSAPKGDEYSGVQQLSFKPLQVYF